MPLLLRLALASLRSRLLTTALTLASIALSVTLLVGIESVRAGVRDSFAGTIRGVDLIVGARGGTLQILLSTVFGIGSPAGSVSMRTVSRWQAHPAVKWVVPYSLGDSHRGYRVVGTTPEFFTRYRYRRNTPLTFTSGRAAAADSEVVIGADVAEKLRYPIGTPVVMVHGMRDIGTSSHEAHPFRVVGILARTFTPIDRAVYATLEGVEAMHGEEGGTAATVGGTATTVSATATTDGAKKPRTVARSSPPAVEGPPPAVEGPPPVVAVPSPGIAVAPPPLVMPGASPPPGMPLVMPGAEPPPAVMEQVKAAAAEAARPKPVRRRPVPAAVAPPAPAAHDHADDQVTAFFVGTKNRFEALMLQREMNTDLAEPLTAVIPGVALGELWQNIGTAEVGLRVIALFAVAISITGMLVALYSALEARRREMAILRAVGAGPRTIMALLVLESTLLAILGCVIGVACVYGGLALAQGPIEQRFGIHLALRGLGETEYRYLALVVGAGMLIGFVPAWKAYRTSLADGLR